MSTLVRPRTGPPVVARPRSGPSSVWLRFAFRRLTGLVAIFVALLVVSFLIVQLIPGDPATALAGADAGPQEIALVRHQLGLDRPLWAQFAEYTGNVLSGHLGTSFMYRQPVEAIVFNRLPFTATIALAGIVVVLLVAIPLGMLIGVLTRGGRRKGLDTTFGMVTGFLDSVPGYIMASFLVVVFARGIGLVHLFPPAYTPRYGASSFVLPIAAIVISPICTVARVVRRETAVVLETDYMRTARGWRLPPLRRHVRWALPNLLTTTLTLSGLVLTGMIGGAIVIEAVFALPGLGSGIIKAILDRDYPVIQGMVLVIGVLAALVNLLVDVLLGLIDRRTLGGSHVSA
jgi:peptide/nickel transport system permease protein